MGTEVNSDAMQCDPIMGRCRGMPCMLNPRINSVRHISHCTESARRQGLTNLSSMRGLMIASGGSSMPNCLMMVVVICNMC